MEKLTKWMIEQRQLVLAILSGILIAIAWSVEARELTTAAIIFYVAAYLIGGFYKAKEGFEEIVIEKKLSVEFLMILAAIGAAIIGYWFEGAILIFIFSLSGALETYTMKRSYREISSLMELQPDEATVLRDGEEQIVKTADLQVGDYLLIKAGERIAADGQVASGHSTIDEAAITGESIPISKEVGDDVFAGTVNLTGTLTVLITKQATDTLFHKIITLVQEAKEEKSPSQQLIERFEGPYVMTVLIAVLLMMFIPHYLLGWSWNESFYRAMVLLVVASPCALVASVMPATLAAISNGARQGIVFKGGVHLENLAHTKAIALDKTGTITKGTPVVTQVLANENENKRVFAAISAIEKQSHHPLAQAVVSYCQELGVEEVLVTVENTETVSGWGIEGVVDGEHWKIGKKGFFDDEQLALFYPKERELLESSGKTLVYCGRDNEMTAIFALEDTVREIAVTAIEDFHKEGIYTIMLTGDREETAKKIAEITHLDEYVANCLPEEKVNHIKALKEKFQHVAMVGDGINDAPALATANVGIAMGAGTDVAIETADIILMKNDLTKIAKSITLAKRMNRIIKQNIAFSIFVIILLIASNFMQGLSLPLGVIGHEGSTILVILNGLRLLKN